MGTRPKENPFPGLRTMALEATPQVAGFDPATAGRSVYGAVMDWGLENGIATLFALEDGTASLYWSTGGGIIGAGSHAPVKASARAFVLSFEPFVAAMTPDDAQAGLPGSGFTDLRALTPRGRLVVRAPTDEFGKRRHPMADVFYAAQSLIAVLRAVTDSKR